MKLIHVVYLLIYIFSGSLLNVLQRKSSQDNGGKQPYEPVAVTFSVELFKWITAATLVFVVQHFAVPAALYCVFNALAFYNLRLVTPPTYRLLINLKVLFSGLLLQGLVGTKLSKRQWAGLCILVMACGVEQWDSFDTTTGIQAVLLICFQAFCSSFAGVYFQLLLQFRPPASSNSPSSSSGSNEELGLWEKNIYMYSWTLIMNTVYLAFMNVDVLLNPGAAVASFDAQVVPIILMSAVGGLMTSLILRDLDVIIKEYANFAEMMCVVIGSFVLLGTPLRYTLLIAIGMVTLSLYLYNVPHGAGSAKAQAEKGGPAYAPVSSVEMDDIEAADDGMSAGTK